MAIKITLPPKAGAYLRKLKPLARHHYFIVTIALFSGVAVVIFLVNQTLNVTSDDAYRAEKLRSTIGSKFNKQTKDTIERIKALQKSTDTANPDAPFPPGRINPFAE
jgi:hypothetical protein